MADTSHARNDGTLTCPHCQGPLTFVGAWAAPGLWGYHEVRTYECRQHGPIFLGSDNTVVERPHTQPDSGPGNPDRDSLVAAPIEPRRPRDAGAIAVPEPDSD